MWEKWLRNFLLDVKNIQHTPLMRRMQKYLHHSYLWHFERECVARGVAIGFFAGIVPIIPFQTLLTIFLSIVLRGNFAIAFLASWISNPITIIPIMYFTYYVGNLILNKNGSFMIHDFTWNISSLSEFWSSFTKWIYQFGKAFFVGLPIVSIGTAFIGYLLVNMIWHISLYYKERQKK